MHSALTCGVCRACARGDDTLCEALAVMGYGLYGEPGRERYRRYKNGALAQYMLVPASNVSVIPEPVSYDSAAKAGTIAGSLSMLHAAQVHEGDRVAILAATGASGAATVMCSPLLGVDSVIGVGRERRSLHRIAELTGCELRSVATSELDADWTETGGLTAALRALTGDAGLDAVVDFMPLGLAETAQAIEALRPGGTAVLAGGNQVTLPLGYGRLMRNQLHIRGARGTPRSAETEVLGRMAAGDMDAARLITHTYPLTAVNDAVRTVYNRQDSPLFVVIHP